MHSLQLLQLTEHGRNFLSSRRKSLLLATGILVAGGSVAYLRYIPRKSHSENHYDGVNTNEVTSEPEVRQNNGISIRERSHKKSGLKSLQFLAAILLSKMGKKGARNLLALVAIVVSLLLVT